MQHIANIFIGSEMIPFRDCFAEVFRKKHSEIESCLFSAISMSKDEKGRLILSPDKDGELRDGAKIEMSNFTSGILNYFEDLFNRKVTITCPGNQTLVIVLWVTLFSEGMGNVVKNLINILMNCHAEIRLEVAGFTNDAVSCFLTEPELRLSPEIYLGNFNENLSVIKEVRDSLVALRLISNRNIDNVGLGFDQLTMSMICAEFSALQCEHYLTIRTQIIDSQEYPYESFGLSSLLFDVDYYRKYILTRTLIDKLKEQGIENRCFNINTLALQSNPILDNSIQRIRNFYSTQTADTKAILAIKGNVLPTNIVAGISAQLSVISTDLKADIYRLLFSDDVNVFESEAILALILGEDSDMFECSVVNAEETTIEDIMEESARFFIDLDTNNAMLKSVSQDKIREIRNRMRNLSVAVRNYQERLDALGNLQENQINLQRLIDGTDYRFGDTDYKLNLRIDKEPLENVYEPHETSSKSIDLRDSFLPIRNQGKQGSCTSFAVSSVVEALANNDRRLSPAFLYWAARKRYSATNTDSGSSLIDVIKAGVEFGVCIENDMPYYEDEFTVEPSEDAKKSAGNCKIIEAMSVNPKLSDIKSAIEDGYPVIVASRIFNSFSDTVCGFVRHPSQTDLEIDENEQHNATHALVVCGYSDEERILVVRNSWGTNFGDNGYCYIPYSYANQYFFQACIITKVSLNDLQSYRVGPKKILNLNTADNNVVAAILRNLINECNIELSELKITYSRLRSIWNQNVLLLVNANNQAQLVQNGQTNKDEEIKQAKKDVSKLKETRPQKLKESSRKNLKEFAISIFMTLLSWSMVYFFPSNIILLVTALVLTFFTVSIFSLYGYKLKKYKQDLNDEIDAYEARISRLQEERANISIKAYINGAILSQIGAVRLDLISMCQKVKAFNHSWIDIFHKSEGEYARMTPVVPYPFVAVLRNDLLRRYYEEWKDKFLKSIDIKSMFDNYSIGQNLMELVKGNRQLNKSIMRGLKNFRIKEYILNSEEKRLFLPDSTDASYIIPEIDSRSKPFCPYPKGQNMTSEKYMFVNGMTGAEIDEIRPYFSLFPLVVDSKDLFKIYIMSIVRYNIS